MSVDYLLYYMMNPSPNTLAVFMRRNGLEDMEAKTGQAVEILDRAAAECGLYPHDIVTAGSSLGAYPAMHSADDAWENHALRTDCVLSLDAGSDWMESWLLLSESQCYVTAELGTDFYLFESPWVGMNREGICRMVNTGNNVTMVGCYFDDRCTHLPGCHGHGCCGLGGELLLPALQSGYIYLCHFYLVTRTSGTELIVS
ncbi:MAG: hypothetical protein V8T45_05745 [Oscillospiraceae bacterium]